KFLSNEIKITDNNFLTNRFLFFCLVNKLAESDYAGLEYEVEEDSKQPRLNFVIESNSYGKKIIFIQPYYLRISNKFGLIIDFKFKKNEDVPFSNSVLRESLSLDKNLRSNRNYYSDKYEILQKFLTENEQLFKSINYHKIKFDINTK